MKPIPEQLHDIYLKETWHKTRMSELDSLNYHKTRYENGSIYTYVEGGKVLGYYERYCIGDVCYLYNVWVNEDCRRGKVFRELYRHFFRTLPLNILEIKGEKQKLGGKLVTEKVLFKKG